MSEQDWMRGGPGAAWGGCRCGGRGCPLCARGGPGAAWGGCRCGGRGCPLCARGWAESSGRGAWGCRCGGRGCPLCARAGPGGAGMGMGAGMACGAWNGLGCTEGLWSNCPGSFAGGYLGEAYSNSAAFASGIRESEPVATIAAFIDASGPPAIAFLPGTPDAFLPAAPDAFLPAAPGAFHPAAPVAAPEALARLRAALAASRPTWTG